MGLYDTYCNITREEWDKLKEEKLFYKDTNVDVQLKVGDPFCTSYFIGDRVPEEVKDGLYLGCYGFVAIFNSVVVGVYSGLKDNIGDHILNAKDLEYANLQTWGVLYGKNKTT